MRPFVSWVDGLVCLATTAAVVAYYGFGINEIQIGALHFSLIQYGVFIAGAYVLLEVMSRVIGQGGNDPLYWFDYFSTAVAWLFINLTAAYVWIAFKQDYQEVMHRLDVPYAKELLIFLTVFSWFAILALQGNKHKRVWQEASVQGQYQPLPPQVPQVDQVQQQAAPAQSNVGTAIVVVLLLIIAILAASALFGGKLSTLSSLGSEKDVPVCERFVGKNADGVSVYHIFHDC